MTTQMRLRRGSTTPALEDGEAFFNRATLSLYIGDRGTVRLISGGGGGGGGGGSGTVTSVNLAAPSEGITASGGPITASGSITLALANDLAALEALTGTNTIYYRSGVDTWSAVTIGSGVSFSGGTLSATGSGTVTSVDITAPAAGITASGGPITASGSITLALANDLAALEALSGTNTIYYRSASDTWSAVTIGSGVSFSGGTLSATGAGGTVTSVALSLPAIFTVSGSPVTTTGTLTGTLATQSANKLFAGPSSGGAAAPTFRAQVVADLPSFTGLTGANSAFADEIAAYSSVGASNRKLVLRDMLGWTMLAPGGRLTLTSGTPVTTSDVTGATTLYYAPYIHDMMVLWNSTDARYELYEFGELSLALGSMTTDLPYDIFAYISGGAVTLEKLAWSSATARATDLAISTFLTKSGDLTRRYLGTICPYSTTQVRVTSSSCRVWNMYNRTLRPLFAGETTDSWSYTTATWREINAGSTVGTSRVEYVSGYACEATRAVHHTYRSNSAGANVPAGIGISASGTNSASLTAGAIGSTGGSNTGTYLGCLPIGFGTVRALELSQATGTTTWYGDATLSYQATGLLVDFYA